ncbi:hypothetical protein FRC03_008500 [Tulasnella sp. 419]|nr:hypothetical protein FRC02_012414 [Tulasnella sp. 418]KAG8968147.1 hypothetical protein FRC03_008500 [Tulasnella sp. 419]
MSFLGNSSSANASSTVNNDPNNDALLSDPPPDSISGLSFSPTGDFLAVSSWDGSVRMYEISATTGQSQGKAMYNHEGPALDVCWSKDGTKVFSGGADKAARMYDITTSTPTQVASHDAPVKSVKWIDAQGGILATGSWDKTVKYWDLRSATPVATVSLPDRCYSMDVQYPLMVVGCAEKHIQVYNLNNPTTLYRSIPSPLKMQTRVVSCFPAANGFAVGSIEGRVAIQYVEEKESSNNFSFKCHRKDEPGKRDQTNVFAVNDISFHEVHGTFSTAGSDGTVTFWDKDSKTRLKSWEPSPGPVSATAFNKAGTLFTYAISYDWSKGHGGMVAGHPNQVRIHACKDEEVKRKPKK